MSTLPHRPVLLEETVEALAVQPDGIYIDGTFGRGGHARAVLARLGPAGRLVGLDRDPAALMAARDLERIDPRFVAVQRPFGEIADAVAAVGVTGRVQGILLDLGVSSPQLDDPGRGFSFGSDGPLDMRMDPSRGRSAAQWLAAASQGEIARLLKEYAEERFAARIARAVVQQRTKAPLMTTGALAELVARVVPTREPGKHPATRTFQALRIQVNDELGELRRCLDQVCGLLAVAGRLAVISFHSLEDRVVKRFMRDESRGPRLPKGVPVTGDQASGRLRILGKPVRPSDAEVAINPRSRSAILRVAERLS